MLEVTASFDDGTKEDIEVAFLMKKYGIPTTFYWPVDRLGVNAQKNRTSLSDEECREILDESIFELGSHTVSHVFLTEVSPGRAMSEIFDSKKNLEDKFGVEVKKFCYPRGYANDHIKEIVKQAGYTEARNTLVGNIYKSDDPLWMTPSVHVGYDRKEYDGKSWLDYALELWELAVKESKKKRVYFHIWGHSNEIDRLGQWGNLKTFLKAMA